jgi:hypothetical protein
MYLPDNSSIFNEGGEKNLAKEGKAGLDFHNVIEFHAGYLFRNIFALQYERRFTDQFSVQAGLGKVFGKDRMQSSLGRGNIDLFNGTGNSSVDVFTLVENATYMGPNLYFSFAFRFYFESNYYTDSNHGGYLEAGVQYYGNKLSYQSISADTSVRVAPATVNVRNTIYHLNWGYFLATEGKVKTTHHFYIGAGMRSSSYDVFNSKTFNGMYGSTTLDVISSKRETYIYPTFQVGYEFGFGF